MQDKERGRDRSIDRSSADLSVNASKRKGASTSGPRTRSKAAKGGSKANTSEGGVQNEEEFRQLRRELRQLEAKRAELSEKEPELGEQVQRNLLRKRKKLEAVCNAKEAESTQRLDKLPKELWERITDDLEENDLFPLALSCRYFRQKQKELVARKGQNGPESGKPRLALKTNLKQKRNECQPASAEYLIFCSKKKVPGNYWYSFHERNCARSRDNYIRRLAALHGHLPLLQELLADSESIEADISMAAGEYSLS